MNNIKCGALFMLLSTLGFSSMQIAVKMCGDGIPVIEKVFFRSIVTAIICFFMLKKESGSLFGCSAQQKLLTARSLCGFLAELMLFMAVDMGFQADVTIIAKLSPFIITVLAVVFLKEKIGGMHIISLLVAITGACFIVNPQFGSLLHPLLLAGASSILSAIGYTLLRFMSGKVNPITIIMHYATVSAGCCIPLLIAKGAVPNLTELSWLILVGVFGSIGQFGVTYSYKNSPAAQVSIFSFSGIIFSALLGLWFLGETLSFHTVIGGTLVISSALITYVYTNMVKSDSVIR